MICRLCLMEKSHYVKIQSSDDKKSYLTATIIAQHLKIKLYPTDFICHDCYTSLLTFHNFWLQVKINQTALSNKIKKVFRSHNLFVSASDDRTNNQDYFLKNIQEIVEKYKMPPQYSKAAQVSDSSTETTSEKTKSFKDASTNVQENLLEETISGADFIENIEHISYKRQDPQHETYLNIEMPVPPPTSEYVHTPDFQIHKGDPDIQEPILQPEAEEIETNCKQIPKLYPYSILKTATQPFEYENTADVNFDTNKGKTMKVFFPEDHIISEKSFAENFDYEKKLERRRLRRRCKNLYLDEDLRESLASRIRPARANQVQVIKFPNDETARRLIGFLGRKESKRINKADVKKARKNLIKVINAQSL